MSDFPRVVTLQGVSPGVAQVGNINITGNILAGRLLAGTGAGNGDVDITKSSTGSVGLTIQNTNSGAAAYSQVQLMDDGGTHGVRLTMNSTGAGTPYRAELGAFGTGTKLFLTTGSGTVLTLDGVNTVASGWIKNNDGTGEYAMISNAEFAAFTSSDGTGRLEIGIGGVATWGVGKTITTDSDFRIYDFTHTRDVMLASLSTGDVTFASKVGVGITPTVDLHVKGSAIIGGGTGAAATVKVGTHDGQTALYVERFSATYPYASIVAGGSNQSVPVGLRLSYRDAAGAIQSGLYIDSAGQVGLNTAVGAGPIDPLHIARAGSGTTGPVIRLQNTSNAYADAAQITYWDGTSSSKRAAIVFTTEADPYYGSIGFWTGISTGDFDEKVQISGAGYLGVGALPPYYPLHVKQDYAGESTDHWTGVIILEGNTASTAVRTAMQAQTSGYHTTGTMTGMDAVRAVSFAQHGASSTATTTWAVGLRAMASLVTDAAGATVVFTNRAGVYVEDAISSGGGTETIGTQYGVYVASLTFGSTNYALYTAGTTTCYFGGNVGIGSTVPGQNSGQPSGRCLDLGNTSTGCAVLNLRGYATTNPGWVGDINAINEASSGTDRRVGTLRWINKDTSGYNTTDFQLYVKNAGTWVVGCYITSKGSFLPGPGSLATNATDGFFYIPGGAGAPTGIPTAQSGFVALYYDYTNYRLYAYRNSTWAYVAL